MSDSMHDTTRGEEDLGRLAIEVERRVAEGEALDAQQLAREFRVPVADAEEVVEAVAAVGDVLFEPVAEAALEGDADLPPPSLPDDYEVVSELGRGGMGIVYRAHQKSLGRDVAVKVLRPGELTFSKMLRRFEQEAKSLARLKHPHIVAIHEVGRSEGCVYFTMDLVEGRPLSELVAERQVTPTEAVRLLRQVTSAISYTHGHGVIHRDLKPANILVGTDGRAYVVDFGLARDVHGPDELTRTGQVIGTANYMSPEQARGDKAKVGEAADIYALGAVLYECLTGKPPFHGKGLAELMTAILHEEPLPPTGVDERVPKALETICLKAMAKEPERRYATARALLDDLERFEEGRTIRARPPGVLHRLRGTWQRHWRVATVGAAAAIVAAIAVLILLLPKTGETVEGLEETAKNLARERKYGAAATVMERAMALEGLRVPSREAPNPGIRPQPQGRRYAGYPQAAKWAHYRAREVREHFDRGRYDAAMDSADQAYRDIAGLAALTGNPRHTNRIVEALWFGAVAAGKSGHPSAPGRFARLYHQLRSGMAESPAQGELFMGTSSMSQAYVIRQTIANALRDPKDPLHGYARRFLSAVLSTADGRKSMLRRWHTGSGMNRMYPNPVDLIEEILQGVIESSDGLPVEVPRVADEDRIDETWFDVHKQGWTQRWQCTRNLFRRMYAHDSVRVYAELRRIARDERAQPLLRRWATGLLAIALDLPPWWDREAPPTESPVITKRVLKLAEVRATEQARWFLIKRVDAAIATFSQDTTAVSEADRRMNLWLERHTGATLGVDVRKYWPSGIVDWHEWRRIRPGSSMDMTIRDGIARIDRQLPTADIQDLIDGLVKSEIPDAYWHHLLLCEAPRDPNMLLWAPGVVPSPTDGIAAGDENIYALWARYLGRNEFTRVNVRLDQEVAIFHDGGHASQFGGLRNVLVGWTGRPIWIGERAYAEAMWGNRTQWPDTIATMQASLGLGALTFHPRRRMVSEPGTGGAHISVGVRVLPSPHEGRMRLVSEWARAMEQSAPRPLWNIVSGSAQDLDEQDVLIIRVERAPHWSAPGPSQSATLLVQISQASVAGTADRIVPRAIEVLRAQRALAPITPGSARAEQRVAHIARWLAAVAYASPAQARLDEVAEVIGDGMPGLQRDELRFASWTSLALCGHTPARAQLAAAGSDAVLMALTTLQMTTPMARLEAYVRLLRDQSDELSALVWELVEEEAAPLANAAVPTGHAGLWLALGDQPRAGVARSEAFRRVYGRASRIRASQAPGVESAFAIPLLILAVIGLVLFLVLYFMALRGRERPLLAAVAFAFGWLLNGQQVWVLPDIDFCVELVGLVLMWRALLSLESVPWFKARSLPAWLCAIALVATALERMGADDDLFARIALAAVGLALVTAAFRVHRLPPPSPRRGAWMLVSLATLLLLPTTFIAVVQGAELDGFDQSLGMMRDWSGIPTGPLYAAHAIGAICVLVLVFAYALRRSATSQPAPQAGRRGSPGTS